jgi:NAD(P)-dependent dehydrogenase (short-subunit alcohol dehydrogenase family)
MADREMLKDKVAIVTGGRGGIGQAICQRFSQEGAIVYAADIQQGKQSLPVNTSYIELDVSAEQSVASMGAIIKKAQGRADILVNAAGIEIEKTIEQTTLDEWNRIFAINVTGTFLSSRAILPLMRKSGGGSIINFGSYDGFIADPELAAYCATKGAVHALTRAMACDYGPENIRVNAICPGYIDTPMLQSFFGSSGDIESLKKQVRDVHPIRRYGTPEDAANLVNWLASDEARYASGQLWILDGGLTAQVQQMSL